MKREREIEVIDFHSLFVGLVIWVDIKIIHIPSRISRVLTGGIGFFFNTCCLVYL